MFQSLRSLFVRQPSRRPASQRKTLALEALEDRLTLSSPGSIDTLLAGNGRVTTSFNRFGSPMDDASDVAVQADGRIVVVGESHYGTAGDFDFSVARYNANGSLDNSFNGGGLACVAFDKGGSNSDNGQAVALDSQGRILVAGVVDQAGSDRFGITRVLPNGQIDTTFGDNGKVVIPALSGSLGELASGIVVDAQGRIVVAGTVIRTASGDRDFEAYRLTDKGSLDSTFGFGGRSLVAFDRGGALTDQCSDVALDAQGRIILAGYATFGTTDTDFAVARLNTNGLQDSSFNGTGNKTIAFDMGGSNGDYATAVAVDSQGRIVLGGTAFGPNGSDFAAARLTPTGALDTTFDTDGRQTISFNRGNNIETASDLAIDYQGRIVLGGTSNYSGTDTDFAAVRLTTAGALDTSFNGTGRSIVAFDNGGGNTDSATAITIDREGRVLLAGWATQADRTNFALARLDGGFTVRGVDASADDSPTTVFRGGALRVSYDLGTLPAGTVSSITIEANFNGTIQTWAVFTSNLIANDTKLIDLSAISNMSPGTYVPQVRVTMNTGSSYIYSGHAIQVLSGATSNGTFMGETFTVSPTAGSGTVFLGEGGTDTLNLGTAASAIASIDGLSFTDFIATASTTQQAIYRGSVYDYVRFTDGREVYFQGIERLQVTGGTYQLGSTPNDPLYGSQWNLHTTDVPGAWRFTTGASNVLLVSLDTGVLVPAGSSSSRMVQDQDLTRLITDPTDDDNTTDYGHGHASINIMAGATNNGVGVAGINRGSQVLVNDVYSGVTVQQAIQDAINYAIWRGMRVVFQGGIQGEGWLTNGGTQAQLEALMSNYANMSIYAVAAGNGGESTTVTSDSRGLSAGVARLQTSHGNVMAVGALEHTATTVNSLANASAVNRASYSNFGPDLTLMAPTDSPAMEQVGMATFNGTSCANPNLAGITSLVWSANTMLTGSQVRQVLIDTAMDIGAAGRDDQFGSGLVDADTAVRRAQALFRCEEVARLVPDGTSRLHFLPGSSNLPAGNWFSLPSAPPAAAPVGRSRAVAPEVPVVLHEIASHKQTRQTDLAALFTPKASAGTVREHSAVRQSGDSISDSLLLSLFGKHADETFNEAGSHRSEHHAVAIDEVFRGGSFHLPTSSWE